MTLTISISVTFSFCLAGPLFCSYSKLGQIPQKRIFGDNCSRFYMLDALCDPTHSATALKTKPAQCSISVTDRKWLKQDEPRRQQEMSKLLTERVSAIHTAPVTCQPHCTISTPTTQSATSPLTHCHHWLPYTQQISQAAVHKREEPTVQQLGKIK